MKKSNKKTVSTRDAMKQGSYVFIGRNRGNVFGKAKPKGGGRAIEVMVSSDYVHEIKPNDEVFIPHFITGRPVVLPIRLRASHAA